jgi:hypothetical protein
MLLPKAVATRPREMTRSPVRTTSTEQSQGQPPQRRRAQWVRGLPVDLTHHDIQRSDDGRYVGNEATRAEF